MQWSEGGLTFTVPENMEQAVFFNPTMELNRDLTVAVLNAVRETWIDDRVPSYLDAMAAAGIRGIRAAEQGYEVTMTDINQPAVELSQKNADSNDINCAIEQADVRRHLYAHHYDVVDLDPFGSPIPYLDPAMSGTAQLLCVTATDTAPLCGAHFRAGVRRYSAVPANTEYHAEVGLRILLSAIARTAARYDIGIAPVLSHVTRHYVRTYLRLHRRASDADDAVDRLGYLVHCDACLHRATVEGLAPALPATCRECGESLRRIGPLWLDTYVDQGFVAEVATHLDDSMGERKTIERLLDRLSHELDIVGHHDHHVICDQLDLPAGPMDDVLKEISDRGFRASRTHFGGTTFKTDAPIDTVRRVVQATADSA